jgi:hypothetical protein
MMSDDVPPTGTIKSVGYPPSVVVGEDDRWTLPPSDKIEKMSRKALRDRIRAIVEHAERGDAQNRLGGIQLAIIRAQYLTEELARRNQDRQTRWIIAMTAVIMVATLWDHLPASLVLAVPVSLPARIMHLSCSQTSTLAAAVFGVAGTLFLFVGSYAPERPINTTFAEAFLAEKAIADAHNRRRMFLQLVGVALLMVSFVLQGVSVFVP